MPEMREYETTVGPTRAFIADSAQSQRGDPVLICSCGGRRLVLAYLTESGTVKAILEHLGLPSTGPPIAPARFNAGSEDAWQDDVPALQ